jgi:uncharacterized glyoxalase superfamily protein PhnB
MPTHRSQTEHGRSARGLTKSIELAHCSIFDREPGQRSSAAQSSSFSIANKQGASRTMPDSEIPTRSQWSISPYFIVDNVVTTADFYRDKLGFHYERFWGDPPCFCMVKRSGIVIMLSQFAKAGLMRPNRIADPRGEAWDAYIWVEDADSLHAEFKSKGVTITRNLCDQVYGCRDFDVEDCNGYRLCFGQSL